MSPNDLLPRAVQLARAGRFTEAADLLERGLEAAPRNAEAWSMLGSLRNELGLPEAALVAFDRALALQPRALAAHVNRGAALAALGRHAEAVEAYDRALAIDPDQPIAHNNRAQALNELDRGDAAAESARRALALRPDYAAARANLGAALYGLGRHDEALAAYHEVAASNPTAPALCDVGMALTALGRYAEAEAVLDQAVARDPGLALARYRRAHARLPQRRFEQAWPDYEHRWATLLFTAASAGPITPELRTQLTLAPARGDFAGQRVLALAEQGVGDVVMFASCLPDLIAEAARVTLACEPRLRALLAASFPEAEVVTFAGLDASAFDRVVALGSLAHAYRRTVDDFPGRPYLRPSPDARAKWAERLGPPTERRRVGVSWRGGIPRTGAVDRSMALATLTPLLARADLDVVSLQYGDAHAEVEAVNAALPRPMRLFDRAETEDFDALAGLMTNLDLVVTVQTAVVHLAGALGLPAHVMVPSRPEWRYGAEGDDMPWYRSVRLHRQSPGETWDRVLDRVVAAI